MILHASFFIFLSKNKKTFRYKSQGSINYSFLSLVINLHKIQIEFLYFLFIGIL